MLGINVKKKNKRRVNNFMGNWRRLRFHYVIVIEVTEDATYAGCVKILVQSVLETAY